MALRLKIEWRTCMHTFFLDWRCKAISATPLCLRRPAQMVAADNDRWQGLAKVHKARCAYD